MAIKVYVNDNGTPTLVEMAAESAEALAKLVSAAQAQSFTDEEKAQARKNIGALGSGEATHAVGEEWVSYTGKIPSGGIPYLGQTVTRETYSALWDYAQAQGLVKTESEWQALSTANNGNVAFYSDGDGSTTFRMPKIVGYVKGASSQSESGSYTPEGLPNITGTMGYSTTGWASQANGAFYNAKDATTYYSYTGSSTGLDSIARVGLDASRSSDIYGNSSHVTPETTAVMFGVYAFGEIANAGELDASTLAAALTQVQTDLLAKLPLAGGTMTGPIVASVSQALVAANNNQLVSILGGINQETGAYLVLSGQDSVSNGAFEAVAKNSGNKSRLVGYPDGSLAWNEKSVVCVEEWHSAFSWYRKYSDGWIEQGGIVTVAGTATVTFHTPFTYGVLNAHADGYSATANNPEQVKITAFPSLTSMDLKAVYSSGNYNQMTISAYWYACGY